MQRPPRLNVIAACTKRKRHTPVPTLRIGELDPRETISLAAGDWINALSKAEGQVTAADLYAGDHWQQFMKVPREVLGYRVEKWVLSAGYGLIPVNARIAPYSATFSAGHEDDVAAGYEPSRKQASKEWWAMLSAWRGPMPNLPRTLEGLLARDKRDKVALVASEAYVHVLHCDIERCVARHGTDRLVVFSAGTAARSPVPTIKYGAGLQSTLGGSLMSLNIRAFRAALAGAQRFDPNSLQLALDRLPLEMVPTTKRRARPGASDDEVKRFISELRRNGPVSCTAALRALRFERGIACEQKRFRHLFEEIAREQTQ